MTTSFRWDRFQVAGPSAASTSSDIAALSRVRDNMEVWWSGPDNFVHGAFWYDDGRDWRGPYQVPGPVGASPTGGIAAVSRLDTTMETWWIGSDTSVRGAFWYDDGQGWRSYQDAVAVPTAAAPAGGMAALSRIATSMEIWWIGLDNAVQGAYWYKGQNNDRWQRYTPPGLSPASQSSGVAAVSRKPTAMEIWWVGPQGSVEGAYWYETDPHPQWHGYRVAPDGSAAQSHSIAAVSRRTNSMDVLWITPEGAVKGAYWNEGDQWKPYPDVIATDNSASVGGGLAAVSRTATSIEVWWIADDGSVQGASWNDGQGWRRDDEPVAKKRSASALSGIGAMSRTAATTQVWWIADDGSVQLAVRDEQSSPFSFRIMRPDDLVDLRCDVVGCRLAPSAGVVPEPEKVTDTYLVRSGDTLWDIAKQFYGDPFKYRLIAAANHLANPNAIAVGQRLTIPRLTDPPPPRSRIVAVEDDAHMVVHFGVQHIFEQSYPEPPGAPSGIAAARAANRSRVVFDLKGTEIPFTASGVLAALTTLGLRVAPLAVPRVTTDDQRPAGARVEPTAPKDDQTAIEAPYRLVVSPDKKYGGFTHAAEAGAAPHDPSRVELWHTRLGVRVLKDNKFVRIDEDDAIHRTVRAVWARDMETPEPPATGFTGSLSNNERKAIVRLTANPTDAEPDPLTVDRLYLSALGAWIDWQGAWNDREVSAYRHQARLGRDQYVRVETPVYMFPFGHRGTLVRITERKIRLENDPAAYLYTRNFIVLRERTRRYTRSPDDNRPPTNLPFVSVSIDPVVSPDLDVLDPTPTTPFVPTVGGKSFGWKITGVDHAGREITMMTALVGVPLKGEAWKQALGKWQNDVVKATQPKELVHPIDVGGADIAFAPEFRRGDTTSRVQYIEFSGTADADTSIPSMSKAHIAIPALVALNRGGEPTAVTYRNEYVTDGFPVVDKAELYLKLDGAAILNFAGASDRGGGFVEPSVSVKALSRKLGAVGDDGSTSGGITNGTFDPAKFLGAALPKLFGLLDLKDILETGGPLTEAPKLVGEQLGFVAAVAAEYANLTTALGKAADILQADSSGGAPEGAKVRVRYRDLLAQTRLAIQKLGNQRVQPLVDALTADPLADGTRTLAQNMLDAISDVEKLYRSPDLAVFLRSLLERSHRSLKSVLETATDATKLPAALRSPVENTAVHYDWFPRIKGWPAGSDDQHVFHPKPNDPNGLAISVDVRSAKDGKPQSDVTAQIRDFELRLLPGKDQLIKMKFGRLGFRVATGGKPEVDVQFDGMEFVGILAFIEKLRQVIPFDGFADPPYVDVSADGATAGFDLALPSLAIGVFSLENIRLGADCRVPFLGEAVTVGFFFCTKEAPFRLTVLAIGGGGWVGIRLAPKGLVLLEMGLEAGASLSVDLGVASGSVSVMVGVYLRLEDKKGQLTAYFRIRGEVEVLGIASASITLELSLTYDTKTGKLIGRASLRVEIEVAFFSASVEITCERQLAGSKGDPALIDIMPPDHGGQGMWDEYYNSFEIGV